MVPAKSNWPACLPSTMGDEMTHDIVCGWREADAQWWWRVRNAVIVMPAVSLGMMVLHPKEKK